MSCEEATCKTPGVSAAVTEPLTHTAYRVIHVQHLKHGSRLTIRKSITTIACVEGTEELGAHTLGSETLETIGVMVASHILSN